MDIQKTITIKELNDISYATIDGMVIFSGSYQEVLLKMMNYIKQIPVITKD